MDNYIDFTDCHPDPYKGYRGANGNKISVIYNDERYMLKFMAKIAEKYAKATNNACIIVGIIHQPKMPASLIKKD